MKWYTLARYVIFTCMSFHLPKIHHFIHILVWTQGKTAFFFRNTFKIHTETYHSEFNSTASFPIFFPPKKSTKLPLHGTHEIRGQRCWKAWPPGTSVSYNSSTAKRWIPAVVQSSLTWRWCCWLGPKGSYRDRVEMNETWVKLMVWRGVDIMVWISDGNDQGFFFHQFDSRFA